MLKAPWSAATVNALNAYQGSGVFHPCTCPEHHKTPRERVLIATPQGWRCPSCSYTQDWAHPVTLISRMKK